MTPTRRPAATAGRLLAHGLGLGLLAGGVVLGAQGAAQALQYVFTGTTTDPGLQLSFRSPPGFLGFRQTGTGQVTGSFNWNGATGSNNLSDISVTFTSNNGNTVTQTFTTGYYDVANNTLVFGPTSGQCNTGPDPCLDLVLAGAGLGNIPGEPVAFASGQDALGDYFDSDNDGVFLGGTASLRRDLTFQSGILRQIPAPLSALALLPLAGLKRYRRRVQRLSQAREAALAELG